MPFNLRSFLATGAVICLTATAAYAQEPTKPELNSLPPDRPALDPTPAVTPPPAPAPRPTEPPPPTPTPALPPSQNGGFQPARPPQPTGQPAPAARPAPVDAGKPVIAPAPAPDADPKWFVGGNPILGFSSVNGVSYVQLGLSALLGYRITDRFAIGPGLTYQYSSYGGTSFTNLGGRVFGQALITDAFFIHAEHEVLRADVPVLNGNQVEIKRFTVNSSFAGLGYRQHIGQRAMFDFMLLYNFDHDDPVNQVIYSQPELRFNFLFDLGR